MPIPDFCDDYFLPPGEHLATLAETEERFAHSTPCREKVWESFKGLWSRLQQLDIKPEVTLIDGSFVTGRKEPGDVDFAILVSPEEIIKAMVGKDPDDVQGLAMMLDPQNQMAVRCLFGAHLLIAPDTRALKGWSLLFRRGQNGTGLRGRDLERDPEWVRVPDEKGILRIDQAK